MSAEQQPTQDVPPQKSRFQQFRENALKTVKMEILRRQSRWEHKDEMKHAKENMGAVIDAATTFWTDVLRFGPTILKTPEEERSEENFPQIPDRYFGYRDMILEAYAYTTFNDGAIPALTEDQLQTFSTIFRSNLHRMLHQEAKSTWSEILA